MIEIDKIPDSVYVVKSKKGGNEFTVQFHSLTEVANYVENEFNVMGVWKLQVIKLPPEVYTRKQSEK